MKVIKKYPITEDILYESLILAWLKGERSLVEDYNITMIEDWKNGHMETGKCIANSIRQKLQLGNNIININIENKCIEVFDKTVDNITYENNYK